ncbi:FtsH protease activity modulator HflK [uncultured Paraglaciecola sp.]|jgi:membrane protease subunit HflK|uniref:FtsH protease activity modulator HflK n=1 Tax=uncultured Paraglaciecola sp. TaxID=1765024 RepID=UPI0025E07C89|nr:FtsH protease activity modulator HflK [uncultured Paraglaciecola sp.]
MSPQSESKSGPPDLDKVASEMLHKYKLLSGGKFKTGISVLILVLLCITAYTSLYTVPSDSVAVVLRFGKFQEVLRPGLHLKVPLGIDRVNIVPTKRQLKQEFGFSTPGATDPDQNINPNNNIRSARSSISPANDQVAETQMVTGDLNTALVEWVIQYRIADPKNYLFEVRDPAGTLRYVSESVMREVVGDRTVDEVITIGRQEIEVEALSKMQALASQYVMGISIDQVQLKNINPPVPVQASFNEVNQAQQEKEKLINEARREYNRIIPLAEGERDQRIREADGYRLKRINEAEGDALRFNALFAEYQQAPEVTRRRIYLETMQEVMPTIKDKIIIDNEALGVLPLLNLTPSNIQKIKGQQP